MNIDWHTFLTTQGASFLEGHHTSFTEPDDKTPLLEGKSTLTAMSDYGIIQVTGKEPDKFLQGQLTCDVREVTQSQASLFAYCNVKGRVISTGWLHLYDKDQYWLMMPLSMVPLMLKALGKYALLSRIQLTDISDTYPIMGIAGSSFSLPVGPILPSNALSVTLWEAGRIIKLPGNIPRYLCINQVDPMITLWNLLQMDLQKMSSKTGHLYDIDAKIAHIYPATTELFTPHMLNYPELGGVSFRKGCYLGQEIIARAHYLGKTKRQLKKIKVSCETQLPPGEALLFGSEEVGNLIEAIKLTENQYLGLAVIQENALDQKLLLCQNLVHIEI